MSNDLVSLGIEELGLNLSSANIGDLELFLQEMGRWNQVHNLTAIEGEKNSVRLHLIDSITVLPVMRQFLVQESPKIADLGSGGGLPGVVLAICMPELNVTCVDTVAKKAAFVQQVAVSLKLSNLRGLHARVETLIDPYQVICSRAFASLPDFVTWSRSALAEGGVWMAMKGKHPQDEIEALPEDVKVFHVEPLTVPGLDVERCMVWMRPVVSAA